MAKKFFRDLGWALIVSALFCQGALAASPDDPVIDAIETLEGKRDPKCAATASRLEDFMYGTPLHPNARFEKNRRLKIFARRVWEAASLATDSELIGKDEISKAMEGFMKSSLNDSGDHVLRFPGVDPITVEQRDLEHYGSVAYSLRAILAVQQDTLLDPESTLPPLASVAIEEFKRLLDLGGLAIVQTADREARSKDEFEISKDLVTEAWESVLGPDGWDGKKLPHGEKTAVDGMLKQLVKRKLSAYEAYNQINNQLLVRNMQVYYARLSWPRDPGEAKRFRQDFVSYLTSFAAEMYLGSAVIAKNKGHVLIREEDVAECAQQLLPHRINDYEDVIYFPNFERDERITIEAYDLDSFRDSGVHWQYMEFALDDGRMKSAPDADPFACELLAENVAQFGVLLLRVAGMEGAVQEKERLSTELQNRAVQMISEKINRHAKMPLREMEVEGIKSSATSPAVADGQRFEEVTGPSGIDVMHRSSDWLNRLLRGYLKKDDNTGIITIPPAFGGSGIAAGDLNNDGIDDVLCLTGLGNRLFLGKGDGTFEDITEKSGITYLRPEDRQPGEPRQPLIADFDNDGNQDILITYVKEAHRLYKGRGDGTFEDVTAECGMGGVDFVGGPATTFDYDNDGLLDIYISYFGDYPNGVLPTLKRINTNGQPDKLFRNLGEFSFKDVTEEAGLGDTGWGQAAVHTDFNGDNFQDIISGNDFGANVYYCNMGDGTFRDVTDEIGTGKPSYTMSIGTSDLNRDLIPDIYISNIVTMNKDEKYVLPNEETKMKFNLEKLANMRVVEANDLFLSSKDKEGNLGYALSESVGRGYSSTGWAWDADFFDSDNDGDDDLYVLNGMNEFNLYSSRNPYYMDPLTMEKKNILLPVSEKESNVFFVNEGGKLKNASEGSGINFMGNSRSAIYLDIDQDGDLDIVTNDYHGRTRVFRNTHDPKQADWIKIGLMGDPSYKISRDAIGAKVFVTLEDGTRIWREIQGSTGYLSVHPKTVHAGVGESGKVDVEVVWPNGEKRNYGSLAVGESHTLSYEVVPK